MQDTPTRFEHVVFVCTNEGKAGDTKRRCGKGEGPALLDKLKEVARARSYKGKVRITRAGCLDLCAKGAAAVAFSRDAPGRETWYTHLRAEDAQALLDEHIDQGARFRGADGRQNE